MKKYGYVVSHVAEESFVQLKKLEKFGCDEYFIEKKEYQKREELTRLLSTAEEGDSIVIANFKSLNMDLAKISELIASMKTMGIRLISIDDHVDSTKRFPLHVVVSLAAKVNSDYQASSDAQPELGRPAISAAKVSEIKYLYNSKKMSMRAIAEACEVSLGTVHKYTRTKKS